MKIGFDRQQLAGPGLGGQLLGAEAVADRGDVERAHRRAAEANAARLAHRQRDDVVRRTVRNVAADSATVDLCDPEAAIAVHSAAIRPETAPGIVEQRAAMQQRCGCEAVIIGIDRPGRESVWYMVRAVGAEGDAVGDDQALDHTLDLHAGAYAIQRAGGIARLPMAGADPKAAGAIARAVVETHLAQIDAVHRERRSRSLHEIECADAFFVADQQPPGRQPGEAGGTIRQHARLDRFVRIETHEMRAQPVDPVERLLLRDPDRQLADDRDRFGGDTKTAHSISSRRRPPQPRPPHLQRVHLEGEAWPGRRCSECREAGDETGGLLAARVGAATRGGGERCATVPKGRTRPRHGWARG